MRTLLDTHAFLWAIADDPRLSSNVRAIMADSRNELFLSAASALEISIKASLGKLRLPDPESFVPEQMRIAGVQGLPVQVVHCLHVHGLPQHHRDPFDRLLVAQSQLEGLPIITRDEQLRLYDVQVIW